jgi:hypothetical protein
MWMQISRKDSDVVFTASAACEQEAKYVLKRIRCAFSKRGPWENPKTKLAFMPICCR